MLLYEYLADERRFIFDFTQVHPGTKPSIQYRGRTKRRFRIIDYVNHISGGWMPTAIFETIQREKSRASH